jgi:DNA polymerase-3 subunit delta'
MLKVLEEPPPDTHFILTATDAAALLPTIRSRLVPLRVRRLGAADVARFLREVPKPPVADAEAERRAEAAFGSIGDALEQREEAGDGAAAAERLLEAARRGPGARYRYALGVKPFGARSEFSEILDAAAELLRDDLAQRLRGAGSEAHADVPAEGLLEAIRELDRAKGWARGNVNPQLIVAHLTRALGELGL